MQASEVWEGLGGLGGVGGFRRFRRFRRFKRFRRVGRVGRFGRFGKVVEVWGSGFRVWGPVGCRGLGRLRAKGFGLGGSGGSGASRRFGVFGGV